MLALRILLFLATVWMWLHPRPAVAGWGVGGCAISSMALIAPLAQEPEPEWRPCGTYPGCWIYRDQGRTVLYDPSDDSWWLAMPGGVLQKQAHGVINIKALPAGARRVGALSSTKREVVYGDELQPWQLNGVDNSKRDVNGEEKVTYRGREITKADSLNLISRNGGAADIPTDADKWSFTIIGDDAACREVANDLKTNPALAPWREKVVVQTYRPEDVMVAKFGFKTGGKPMIYVQKPDGEVLLRREDYIGGAGELAAAIRRADPNYDPNKDPDGKPKPPPAPSPLVGPVAVEIPDHFVILGGIGLAAAVLVALNRKQQA